MTDLTPVPLGTDIQVPSELIGRKFGPSLAALGDGRFVAVWASDLDDSSSFDVYARIFDGSGTPIGSEFRINTTTAGGQVRPAVAPLDDGGFVVTWTSTDADRAGIYGQLYNASGTVRGTEFRVNATTVDAQDSSHVTTLADGGFLVNWRSRGQDGSEGGIYAQRYNATGGTVGVEFKINNWTYLEQSYGSAVGLTDGDFVVTWTSFATDNFRNGIYAQRFNADGTRDGEEFRVNTTTHLDQQFAAIAATKDGGFVIAWESDGQDGDSYGIYAQRYDASGRPAGGEFRVNSVTTARQDDPSITALADGGFLVIWRTSDSYSSSMKGQRFDASGVPVGTEFLLNDVAGEPFNGRVYSSNWVVQLTNGEVVAGWTDEYSSAKIYARLFDLPSSNSPPAGTDATLTLAEDSVRAFTAADFGFTDPDTGAALAAVRIDTLPAAGSLTFDGIAVTPGQVIAAGDLGKLAFAPGADASGDGYASLGFSVFDGTAVSAVARPRSRVRSSGLMRCASAPGAGRRCGRRRA
jgi:hypothetical protein